MRRAPGLAGCGRRPPRRAAPAIMRRHAGRAALPRLAASVAVVLLLLARGAGGVGVQQDNLRPNRQAGVVVGDEGFICATFNGGFTWTEEELEGSPDVDLQDVFVLDDNSAVAVGGDCQNDYTTAARCGIFRRPPGTPEAGSGRPMVAWSKMPLGAREGGEAVRGLTAVTFCNATLGFVVGESGTVMRTLDGGRNWNVISSGITYALRVVHCVDPSRILLGGDAGNILRSKDSGETWEHPAARPPSSVDIVALLMQGPTYALAFSESSVYMSREGGLEWQLATHLGLPSDSVQDAYLSYARDARYTAAVLNTGQTTSTVQLLGVALQTGRLHNVSAQNIPWLTQDVHISGRAVALPGAGDDCEGCRTIVVAGLAQSAGNAGCNIPEPSCATDGTAPAKCCGPLQMKTSDDSVYATALYSNRSNVRVPVGCKDFTKCVTLRAVAFTTGTTALPQVAPVTTPPPAVTGVQLTVTLVYTVDISSYTVFQVSCVRAGPCRTSLSRARARTHTHTPRKVDEYLDWHIAKIRTPCAQVNF